jgi:hypothetical protein
MMQSIEKHQEISKGEDAVMTVRESGKQCRVCNLSMERHQKMSERNWGNSGSWRTSAAACRKVTYCAKVAWSKKETRQANREPWKELVIACRKMPPF